MKTTILKDTIEDIKRAGEIIAGGGIVAFPTETVYGLGANALDEEAVKKIYNAKGRPSDNPMIVHISQVSDVYDIADVSESTLSEKALENLRRCADAFWPGPLTMVLPKKKIVPLTTTGGLDTVAIRMPSHKTARMLIEYSGCPIAAPSANLSGKPSPTTAEHTLDDMDGRIDAIIFGSDCQVGIESTVVDMRKDEPVILRPGRITAEDLSNAIGGMVLIHPSLNKKDMSQSDVDMSQNMVARSPGMKYKHYAPEAEMQIFISDTNDREKALKIAEKEANRLKAIGKKTTIISFTDGIEAAHDLFRRLRDADKAGYDVILAVGVSDDESGGVGFSVMNRMLKSAGYNVKKV
ncbi:MAG: L-threonylcarbamoyladenylate synthase [Clostridiales bacterium]|nr:L-threonylcarbamoyladenylate synthase [Clostridiales bacterium]MDY6117001.1 L-threonylcarbamoyladenylate synthase [Anaerovoracaceae bacterium]